MIPKKIHQTAPTTDLSPEEARVLSKNKATLGSEWEFFLHDDEANQQIMEAAFPEHADAYRSIRRGVVQADIARCVFLYHFGGWYFDTDYRLLRSFDSPSAFEGEGSSKVPQDYSLILPVSGIPDRDQHLVCNSIFASEKGHPFWRAFLDHIFSTDGIAGLAEGNVEATTGPLGLSRFYLERKDEFPDVFLPDKKFFHPRITMGGFWSDAGKECYGIHWCWGSWRSKNLMRKVKNFTTRKVTSWL